MCCGVTMPTMPSSVTARRSSAVAASGSMRKGPNLPMGATSEGEAAAREPPGAQIVERGGELVERIAARDELVDLEPAAEVEVGEHREVAARAGRAVAAAEDRLVLV